MTQQPPAPLAGALSRLVVLVTLLLGACAYEFRVNDRVVYTPLPLFTDYHTEDAALGQCLSQAIERGRVVQTGELTALRCTGAGLASLEGIQTFYALETLDLSDNRLRSITPLLELPALANLDLSGNDLTDVSALGSMPWLEQIDLRDNPRLICPPARDLGPSTALTLPAHCPPSP